MKLVINYDLINEILKANTGLNIKRFNTKMGIYLGTFATVDLTTIALHGYFNPVSLASGIVYALVVFGGTEFATKVFNKQEAELRLRALASSLSSINIYTDSESIKQAKLYKTQYKLVHNNKPAVQQNKFIMLPTTGTLNAQEVSLLQEHIIGSREYALSIGEPKKSESKVLSKVFAQSSI